MIQKINYKKISESGFTLVELMVVISIIGFLAAIVMTNLNNARVRARDAKRLADMKQVGAGLELYFNGNNSYPVLATAAVMTAANTATPVALSPTYIATLPTAPTPNDGACNAAQNSYTYSGSTTTYSITFCLSATTGGYGAGVHTLTPAGVQ